jgi:hypothetical protein
MALNKEEGGPPLQPWGQSYFSWKGPRKAPCPPASCLMQTGCPPPPGLTSTEARCRKAPMLCSCQRVLWVSPGQMVSRQPCWSPPAWTSHLDLLDPSAEPCKQKGLALRWASCTPCPEA